MTNLMALLPPDRVIRALPVASKAEALRRLADRSAVLTGLAPETIFEALTRRERLGSTAIGHGVAIPHAVLPALDRSVALFAVTQTPIAFDAVDGKPVSAIFVLLTPQDQAAESTHILATVCRALRTEGALGLLCRAEDDATLHTRLAQLLGQRLAA